MDFPNQITKPKSCQKHNQPIVMMDPHQKKGGCCIICMQEKTGMILAEDYLQKLNGFINQSEEQCNAKITLLQNLHNFILNYKNYLIQSLEKILKVILGQIETFEAFKSSDDQNDCIDDLQLECQQYELKCEMMKIEVRKQLQDFQSKYFNTLDALNFNLQAKNNYKGDFLKFLICIDQRSLQGGIENLFGSCFQQGQYNFSSCM